MRPRLQFSFLFCVLLAENLTFKGVFSILYRLELPFILEFLQLAVTEG